MRPEDTIPAPSDFDAPLTACRLCGSPDVAHFDHDFRGVRIGRCGRCGVKFMNPQYTDAYLDALYARYNNPDVTGTSCGPPKGRVRFLPRKRDANIRLIGEHARPGRFLSIGSGSGDEIRAALGQGWSVEGYDVDPVSTAQVAERFGVPVYSGDLASCGLPNDAYECVYMDQVLEHPKDPAAYLRLAHRVLTRTGVLYLGVPNIASVSSSYKTILGKRKLKALRGRHYDTWHHLFYYSPASLTHLLERVFDFELLMVGGDPVPEHDGLPARIGDALRERFPWLDSSFRLIARPIK
jgi:SAM-dependent methyltransferase